MIYKLGCPKMQQIYENTVTEPLCLIGVFSLKLGVETEHKKRIMKHINNEEVAKWLKRSVMAQI